MARKQPNTPDEPTPADETPEAKIAEDIAENVEDALNEPQPGAYGGGSSRRGAEGVEG